MAAADAASSAKLKLWLTAPPYLQNSRSQLRTASWTISLKVCHEQSPTEHCGRSTGFSLRKSITRKGSPDWHLQQSVEYNSSFIQTHVIIVTDREQRQGWHRRGPWLMFSIAYALACRSLQQSVGCSPCWCPWRWWAAGWWLNGWSKP